MNANELANELMKCSIPRLFYLDELMNNAAIMLRQQQAEIESLLKFINERGETGQLIIWKAQEK